MPSEYRQEETPRAHEGPSVPLAEVQAHFYHPASGPPGLAVYCERPGQELLVLKSLKVSQALLLRLVQVAFVQGSFEAEGQSD